MPHSSSPSSSPRALHSCCYIQHGSTAATGFLARIDKVYFVVTTHTMLPDAASCTQASAVFHYNLPSAVCVTFDPELFFLTSPAEELVFTLAALSLDSQQQQSTQALLPFAYNLSTHVPPDAVGRYTACKQYAYHLHSNLQVSVGYVLSTYIGWVAFSDAALEGSSGGGVMIGGEVDQVLGLHRAWNGSRGWNEGTLIADILPIIHAHLSSRQQHAARVPWFRSRFMYVAALMSAHLFR